jgi:hypothetical protein
VWGREAQADAGAIPVNQKWGMLSATGADSSSAIENKERTMQK